MTELRQRVRAGLLAFAAGDALGAPWEGWRADDFDRAPLDAVIHAADAEADWLAGEWSAAPVSDIIGAAITGGILGCRHPDSALPWLPQMRLPDDESLDRLSAALAALRSSA